MIPSHYGLMAEFETPRELVAATRRAYAEGYRRMDAYSPFPVPELAESLGVHSDRVALLALTGGVLGATVAYALQWWVNKIAYPINIGGRPLHSWPAFIIVTFELAVLFAGIATVFGMLALNGLPRPHHPTFNVPGFEAASRDRFFLCIEAVDPRYDEQGTKAFLQGLCPIRVVEVCD